MSTKYKNTADVPTGAIACRLNEISTAIQGGRESTERETTMRVPAECDRDADLVLYEASIRLKDPRLSSDPLTALAAVMRQHGIGILAQNEKGDWASEEDIVIVVDDNGGMLSKILVLEDKASLFADDIKPEQSND